MRRKEKGSITVFLSLVMVLVISIVGASIDLARVNLAMTHSYRTLNSAMDATFTNYCEELFEDYHLFLLNNNKEMKQLSGEEFLQTMSDFVYATFSPNENVTVLNTGIQIDGIDLMEVELEEMEVIDTVSLLDYNGEIFAQQVEEYMKYEVAADGVSSILEKIGLLEESKETIEILRKKMEVEEEVSKIDKNILDLMEEVEGLTVTYKGLKMTSDGKIGVEGSFAKKLTPGEATPGNLGITHNVVWNSVKGHHSNLIEKLQQIETWYEQMKETNEELEEVEENQKKIIAQVKELSSEAKKVKSHVEEAEKIIEKIKKLQEKSKQELQSYKGYLTSKKGSISGETYEGIWQEYEELESYVNKVDENGVDVSLVGDIIGMKETLIKNKEILTQTIELKEAEAIKNGSISETFMSKVVALKGAYQTSYSVKKLAFNYDTLSLDNKAKTPFSVFADLVSGGILGLVMDDTDKVSKASMVGQSCYSSIGEDKQSTKEEKVTEFADQLSDQESLGVSSNMEYYEASFGEQSFVGECSETMIRRVLFNEYGSKKFKNYTTSLDQENELLEKETVLEYEMEYLINGRNNDYDNVKITIMKTIFFRTMSNYIALLMDSKCRLQAAQGATIAVGFTGLTPLITLTKHLILMTWAFEESLVDMRGLLEGKEVAFFKSASEFSIRYSELLLISKEMVKNKANQMPEQVNGTIAFTYVEYLRCYMLLVKKEVLGDRMMDLIEANMKVRYNSKFSLREGIFGITVHTTCSIGAKFLSLPGIQRLSGYEGGRAMIEITTSYSY